jgi:tRNA(fMet)-specific endonuclease VapC
MLDTNIIAYIKNNRPESVLKRFQKLEPSDVCISSITMAEIEYGICHSSNPERNRAAFLLFMSYIEVLDFDVNAAREYGKIRQDLTAKGTPIGSNDLLIAAHAKSRRLILVTNNTGEFERVEGLQVENWV